jgi:hypothetical protein
VLPDDLIVDQWIDIGDTRVRTLPESLSQAELRWNGIPLDQRILSHPETISVEEILSEFNVEIRRVMLERVGFDRFMQQAKAEELDRDTDAGGVRRLLKIQPLYDEPIVGLLVNDPSTGRQYILRVPPYVETCHQAAAWIAGFDNPDDYHPLLET